MSQTIHAKAAVTDARGSFSIEDVAVHPPGPGEVRVAMKASGICHTDYDSLSWGHHMVIGHEGAGIVESVGEGVSHVKAGDKVKALCGGRGADYAFEFPGGHEWPYWQKHIERSLRFFAAHCSPE